jgi:hypothetical protein
MATTDTADQSPTPGVEVQLKYLANTAKDDQSSTTASSKAARAPAAAAAADAAVYHASEAGTQQGAKQQVGDYSLHSVTILDGRHDATFLASLTLDGQGFRLVSHVSAVQDFYNDQELVQTYNSEIEAFLLDEIPSARRVIIFDHTRRSSSAEQRQELRCREPSSMVHNDYTEWSAVERLKHVLEGDDDVTNILHGEHSGHNQTTTSRFAIVNVWRPITHHRSSNDDGLVESWPLTFCDSTTVNVERDLVSIQRIAKDRVGEIQMAHFHPSHQWYYFPSMKVFQEIAIFKTYDSIKNGTTNRFTIHTSFEDPSIMSHTTPKPRQSIETRAFVIF